MDGIKKTLTLERQKKGCERTVNQYRITVVISMLMTSIFVKKVAFETFLNDILWVIPFFALFIFSVWRYLYHRKDLKYINKELKRLEIINTMDARRKLKNRT